MKISVTVPIRAGEEALRKILGDGTYIHKLGMWASPCNLGFDDEKQADGLELEFPAHVKDDTAPTFWQFLSIVSHAVSNSKKDDVKFSLHAASDGVSFGAFFWEGNFDQKYPYTPWQIDQKKLGNSELDKASKTLNEIEKLCRNHINN
jgi:hypothetical protein